MNNKVEFDKLYENIDQIYDYDSINNITRELKNKSDSLYFDNEEILNKINYEIQFLSCNIKKGELELSCDYLNEMCLDQFNYLKERCENTHNLFLKFRYSFLIFNYYDKQFKVKKDEFKKYKWDFLRNSIDILFKLIEYYKKNNTFKFSYNNVLEDSIINLYTMGKKYNYKKDLVLKVLISNIKDENISDRIRRDLIEFAISKKELLKENQLIFLEDVCWKLYESNKSENILKLGKKVSTKIKCNNYNWNEELGKYYEKLGDTNKHDLARYNFYKNSHKYYKSSKNKSKINELESKLEKVSDNINFPKISLEIPAPDISSDINKFVNNIINEKRNYNQLINYLIFNNEFPLMINKNKYDCYNNSYSFGNFCKIVQFDSNYNIRKSYSTELEKKQFNNENFYKISLELFVVPYLNRLFYCSYKSQIINYEDVIKVLTEYDWEIKQKDYSKDLLYYLKPIIEEFFENLKSSFLYYDDKDSNFILFIDSMLLKIELIIREIAKRNNINIKKQNNKTAAIKSLNDLFEEDKIKEIFNEVDYDFLKFILINPFFNLRNNAAHGLNLNNYNFNISNLIMLCFLRLLKYL